MLVSILPLFASQASTEGWLRSWMIMSRCSSSLSVMLSADTQLPVTVPLQIALKPFSPSPLGCSIMMP
ncbi:Uncharacterised protein [Burkholderia gladioli]|nr:Uncharacterised protein [Burkholderia gladioli]